MSRHDARSRCLMIRMRLTDRTWPEQFFLVVAVAIGGTASICVAQESSQNSAVLLRLTADSGVVGHYKFTTTETHQLAFDIPDDDPRASLLASATAPKHRTTEVAVTIVSLSDPADEEARRYLLYWLGYKVSGDEVRSLTGLQWDSIFQEVGRRAVFHMSSVGEPRGVEVTSDAARPVGRAFGEIVSSLGLALPTDFVNEGDKWDGQVSVPIRRPDGTRLMFPMTVTYRLVELSSAPEGLMARIEFDGIPVGRVEGVEEASGQYFGEAVFAVTGGRYERMSAGSRLEVKWSDSGGLPASSSHVEWQGGFQRSRGG